MKYFTYILIATILLTSASVRADINFLLEGIAYKYFIENKPDAELLTKRQIVQIMPKSDTNISFTDADWNDALFTIQTRNYISSLPTFLHFSEYHNDKQFEALRNLANIYFREATHLDASYISEKLRFSYILLRKAYDLGKEKGELPKDGSLERHLGALCELGVANEGFFHDAIEKNCSLEWYNRAALAGDAQSAARIGLSHFLGLYDLDGQKTDNKNFHKTYSFLKLAIRNETKNNFALLSDINFALSILILEEIGTNEPQQNAIPYLTASADNGHMQARYLLGSLYEHGLLNLSSDHVRSSELKDTVISRLSQKQIKFMDQTVIRLDSQ